MALKYDVLATGDPPGFARPSRQEPVLDRPVARAERDASARGQMADRALRPTDPRTQPTCHRP